jgi:hypothetical protein
LVTQCSVVGAATLDFEGVVGDNGSPFESYTQSGFTVSSLSGRWVIIRTYGNPAPSIQFFGSAQAAVSASVRVIAMAGAPFRFSSVDLYSSITPIPYVFTGLRNSTVVFTVSGTVPNTFGAFAKVPNADADSLIDTLEIALTNPATPCCSGNPMGLDNIVVTLDTTPAAVPTLAEWVFLSLALVLAGFGLRRIRSSVHQ